MKKKRSKVKLRTTRRVKGGRSPKHLTAHFTLAELTFSQTAARMHIDNTPNQIQITGLRALCVNVLEPLRTALELPIVVTSGYRSEPLNRLVGGAPSSQHMRGQAADILCPPLQIKRLFKATIELKLPFDQLIYEGGRQSQWVHVSYDQSGGRGEILAATFPAAGGVKYQRLTRADALNL